MQSRHTNMFSTLQGKLNGRGNSMQANLTSKWNQKLTKDIVKKDSGLRKMNAGASFLSAPINTYYDKKITEALN